jgi:translation elongation factor P/translation initiation factor 5A
MNQYQVNVEYSYTDNNEFPFTSSVSYIMSSENESEAMQNIQNMLNENTSLTHLRYNGNRYEVNKNTGIVTSATLL